METITANNNINNDKTTARFRFLCHSKEVSCYTYEVLSWVFRVRQRFAEYHNLRLPAKDWKHW